MLGCCHRFIRWNSFPGSTQVTADVAAGVDLTPAPWQLEKFTKLGLKSQSAALEAAFGRGTAALGPLPSGVDPRALSAALILCANSPRDLKDSSPHADQVKAGAFALLAEYLRLSLAGLQLDAAADRVRVICTNITQRMY